MAEEVCQNIKEYRVEEHRNQLLRYIYFLISQSYLTLAVLY